MNSFRTHYLSKITAFITGVVFLNMSFFLAEVSMLKYNQRDLIENIANLIFNSGFEEERDGQSSHNDNGAKEVDLLVQQVHNHNSSSCLISTRTNLLQVNHYLHANYSLSFFQPPDITRVL